MSGIVLHPEPLRRILERWFGRRFAAFCCRLGWHDWSCVGLWVGPVGHVNVRSCDCRTRHPKDVAELEDAQAACDRRELEGKVYR